MIPSPCIGSCGLDADTQLCAGCARSGAEIAAWKDADPADRARTWAALPGRRAALGIGLYRLPWTPGEILEFVAGSLRGGLGTWSVEAAGRFAATSGPACAVDRRDPTIAAVTARAAIRWTIARGVRALAVPPQGEGDAPERERIVLAVPKGLATATPGLVPLGPDGDAIRPEDREARLYDLGFEPTPATRTYLRTADPGLAAELDRHAGRSWGHVRAALAGRLADYPPAWVAANPVARIEVFGSADSRALLDRDGSAAARWKPAGVGVPSAFWPCALFDPAVACPPLSFACSTDFTIPATLSRDSD